ncbi:hypothetical protein DOTSEDRAFT_35071 [Dothistroma septosporum NZE10]|uniref:Uncharacterized protein n=1 Tax=Dothistroma septosporum (strain NZE10 / CBS 128990) TaxID=675120 RepID=N1PMR6_DOTSN|nr:hypothetical protein DOTSEDRAFT_35071 [Dothistroma septosporum NZE10]
MLLADVRGMYDDDSTRSGYDVCDSLDSGPFETNRTCGTPDAGFAYRPIVIMAFVAVHVLKERRSWFVRLLLQSERPPLVGTNRIVSVFFLVFALAGYVKCSKSWGQMLRISPSDQNPALLPMPAVQVVLIDELAL